VTVERLVVEKTGVREWRTVTVERLVVQKTGVRE